MEQNIYGPTETDLQPIYTQYDYILYYHPKFLQVIRAIFMAGQNMDIRPHWIFKIMFIFTYRLIEAEWRIYASENNPSLIQIMASRLVGAKPLSGPMLEYC